MHARAGQALIAMYMIVLVLSVLGGSFLTKGMTTARQTQVEHLDTEAFYLAQGGIEDSVAQFISAIANFQLNANATCYPDTDNDGVCTPDPATQRDVFVTAFCETSGPCPSDFPAGSQPRAYSWVTQAEPTNRTVVAPDGTMALVKNYEVTTLAPHPLNPGFATTVHQVIARRLVYTFQHAVFYDKDLEILPGPNMTLTGRVHTNSDMYLNSNNMLTIDSEYVHAIGSIYNRRKNDNSIMSGQVQIKDMLTGTFDLMAGLDSTSATWASESQTRWGGTVKSGIHGLTALAIPTVGSTQPGGYYDQNAGVRVVNGTVTKGAMTLQPGVDIPPGTVTTVTTFYNNREGKWVKMTELDLKKLAGYYDCNGDGTPEQCYPNQLPSNGLLYATRNDATGAQQPGIRLLNGASIERAGGLTLVTNDPVYVKGDYNTATKKPAAIIADALNLLSNSWSDGNSTKSVSSRVASNTTVNSAFLVGINTSVPGVSYNGGLENYPRLHEKWDSKTLMIRGSFVSLWTSQIGTGTWVYGNPQYTAPIRNWNYDTDFTTGQLPPFTPWAVEADRGAWWKE